jgi:hypothetical protein
LQSVSPAPQAHAPLTQLAPEGQAVVQLPQSKGSLVRFTHALLQLVSPEPQLVVQTPAEQTWLAVHVVPQAPQFVGSLCVSVQTPLQRRPPLKQAQAPFWHVVPPLDSLTQELPQAVSPVPQDSEHVLLVHCWLPVQTTPHPPQSLTFDVVSTHAPLHSVCPAGQVHAPATQLAAVPQVTPQPPQSRSSVCRLTQALLQLVRPVPQFRVQTPAEQTWPVVHTVPQAPQSLGSLERSTHCPLHAAGVVPCVQAHALETHCWPPPQTVPQAPQSWASLVRFTQA